jgi:hypothetical protein
MLLAVRKRHKSRFRGKQEHPGWIHERQGLAKTRSKRERKDGGAEKGTRNQRRRKNLG